MASMEFILTTAAKGAVILVMSAAASALLARSSAALRHLAWSIGLTTLVLLPLLAWVLPELPVSSWRKETPAATTVFSIAPQVAVRDVGPVIAATAAPPAAGAPQVAVIDVSPVIAPTAAPTLADTPPVGAAEPVVVAFDEAAVQTHTPSFSPSFTLTPAVLLRVWVGGAALLLLWLVMGHLRAARLARRASPELGAEWEELVAEAADLAELSRPFSVRETDDLTVPATVGILRPVVLVPVAGRDWSVEHRRDVLIHEFAHVRRRDCLTHTIGWIACALHWMNPMAWVALWRTRVEREHACDDIVLRAGVRPSEYAEELLQTAHLARLPLGTGAASLAMARRSQLSSRLLAILDTGRHRTPLSSTGVRVLGVGAALIVLPIAALAPARASTPTPSAPIIAGFDEAADAPVLASAQGPDAALQKVVASVAALSVRTPFAAATTKGPAMALSPAAPFAAVGARLPMAALSERQEVAALSWRLPIAATAAGSQQHQTLCQTSKDGRNRTVRVGHSTSFSGSGNGEDGSGNSYVVWSGPDCSVVIELSGEVRFDSDESDVASLSRGGRFEIRHSQGDRERHYVVRSRDGELERTYTVDGRPAELDADALRWRSTAVLEYIRRSGYDAENRAKRILQRSGIDGVLEEIEEIDGDWAASKYFGALLASARLDDAGAAKIVSTAGRRIESDYYLAMILGNVPVSLLGGSQTRAAYVTATDGIESDYYLSQTLTPVLSTGAIDPTVARTLLKRAGRMESDHYLAGLLMSLAGTGLIRGELLADYLEAAKSIESDHYKAQVLGRLVPEFASQPDLLAAALTAAETIESDHYVAEYLKQVLTAKALDGSAIEPFFAAARSIESDYYRSEVLVAALGRSSAPLVVTRALESAPQIGSDHYLAEVLLAAKRRGLTPEQQVLWKKAADSIESDYYLGKVMREQ